MNARRPEQKTLKTLLLGAHEVAPFGDCSDRAGGHLGRINLQTIRPGERVLREVSLVIQVMTEGITNVFYLTAFIFYFGL